jgi:hypothetical protein
VGATYGACMATVTVTDLLLNFADACRALVPSLDRAVVPWRDGDQYDNWDRVAEALFESLVTEPCAFQAVGGAGLARLRTVRYGFAPDRKCNAWVALRGNGAAQVIALSSVTSPFDHVKCEEPAGLLLLEGARFMFVYDVGDGPQTLESVNLLAD